MPRILVCDPIAETGLHLLKRAGFHVDVRLDLTSDELKREIGKYDAVIVRGRTLITREHVEAGKQLKVIARAGVGLDNIDVSAARERGIEVVTAAEVPAPSVAELTIGLLIALARRIPEADRGLKEGKWLKKRLAGVLLSGKTIGIVGFGRIGGRVAKIARAMGMRILVTDPRPDEKALREVGGEAVPLREILRNSDVVTLHVPLTAETHHMIGEQELRLMKKGAFLINTSRGPVVDEGALLRALKEGWIAGAALDVYEVEPPTNLELLKLPNIVCTPHVGSETKETQEEIAKVIAEKLAKRLGAQCTST